MAYNLLLSLLMVILDLCEIIEPQKKNLNKVFVPDGTLKSFGVEILKRSLLISFSYNLYNSGRKNLLQNPRLSKGLFPETFRSPTSFWFRTIILILTSLLT